MKYLLEEQRKQVGFEYIINKLNINSPYGAEKIRKLEVFTDVESLNKELSTVENTIENLKKFPREFEEIEKIFMTMKDIRNSLKKCDESSKLVLDEVELFEIKLFSIAVNNVLEIYNKTKGICGVNFKPLSNLCDLLDPENTKLSTFYIYDSYSDKLKKVRENKKEIERKVFSDVSELELETLKKERLDLVILEDEEEKTVKKYLTIEIKKHISDLIYNTETIGSLDFLISKAKLFINESAVKPKIVSNETMDIRIIEGVSLEIKEILSNKGKDFTPVSIDLKSGVTVITGANMGGKSVSLKTLVQNLILAQFGFYVFAKEATIPQLDFIYYISDDMQSITKGLSTFGAEIVKMKPVIELTKRCNGFIALDEFARGTNPQEGSIIVKSLSQYLNDFKTSTVISTHYDGVVTDDIVHYQVVGLRNLDFTSLKYKIDLNKHNSIEIIQEHMDYRLEKVTNTFEVPKEALQVAELLGFEEEILNIAKKMY